MSVVWKCTGISYHTYSYKNDEGIQQSNLGCVDFIAEADELVLNELWETSPVLTEAGIEAFVGLIPYAQGFTVLADDRLTDMEAQDVLIIGSREGGESESFSVSDLFNCTIGDYLTAGTDGGDEPI